MKDDSVTVMVETAGGVLMRTIRSASPLRDEIPRGKAAEHATHGAAATWGLPDFVYRPALSLTGSGSREVGDGLLVVGDLGIVIQVKARDAPSADEAKERRWLQKQAAKGLRQAHGTIRRLQQKAVPMTNGRGRVMEVDGAALRWISVVVIEHPEVPDEVVIPVANASHPSLVLLRRDWEFLFEQLKSTHAVSRYFERIAGEELALGDEVMRYFQLAQADDAAPPGAADSEILGPRGRDVSGPVLPLRSAATEDDAEPHLLIRLIFEDIAISVAPQVAEPDRLRFLATLDGLPIAHRSLIGEFLLEGMEAVVAVSGDTTEWRLRRIAGPSEEEQYVQLAFGVCSQEHNVMIQDIFSSWVQLRHHEFFAAVGGGNSVTTVGVLITPRRDGVRPWDTTMIATAGDLKLDDEQLTLFREAWKDVKE